MRFEHLDNVSTPARQQTHKAVYGVPVIEGEQEEDTGVTAASPGPSDPVHLTKRQVEVLRLVAAGMTNKQIANQLDLSIHTVETHLHKIYGKLKITTRGAAIRYAIEHKLG